MSAPTTIAPTSTESYGLRQRVGLFGGLLAGLLVWVLPVPEGLSVEAWRVVGVGTLMATWWITEAIPISVTALLPIILLPVLGVSPVRDATTPYANPLIFLFMGGFIIATAMERWHLHRRIALVIIRAIGVNPRGIIGGFMLASAFLSMWVSNTATAMMMLPIALSVVELVRTDAANSEQRNFALVLLLSIAYACSVGGMGTLIGTPTNALLAGFVNETYGIELAFFDWFLLGMPVVILGLALMFVVLTRVVFPVRLAELPGGRAFITTELAKLGQMSKAEKLVAFVFTLTAASWMLRPQLVKVLPGLSDTGIAIFGAVLLFMLPVDWRKGVFVLDWQSAKQLPWGVLLLFGGGLSLASAINKTGLAAWIGSSVTSISTWPLVVIVLVVVVLIVFLTELTSNVATAAAFLPILASVAIGLGESPLVLIVPAALAASAAFMLPVATPPNAIIYGSGAISIPQMARAGFVLNLLFILLVTALVYTLLPATLGVTFGELPSWATNP